MSYVNETNLCDIVLSEACIRYGNAITNVNELEYSFDLMFIRNESLIVFDEDFCLISGRVRMFIRNRMFYYLLKLASLNS